MAITTNGAAGAALSVSADLAATISDESGTGVVVFNNSPTLVTPTLGTANATAIELGHATDTTIARASAGVVSIEGNAVLVSGGALGTPASGTLTNATGLPVSGITASTSTALGVGTVELGHATDTTIARSSAGVITVEGIVVPTISSTDTLTNKTLTDAKVNLGFDAETASYTAVLANNSQVVTMSNASANTFSIPTNASVAFPVGTQINVLQIGAGQTTISAVTPGTTTVLSTGATAASPKTRTQYSMATCIKTATDNWYVVGDIS
jgi:hypothetical protein